MRLSLVDNARDFWKWASVHLHLIATAAVAALLLVPEMPIEIRELLPEGFEPIAVIAWLVLGILARVFQIVKPGAIEAGKGKGSGNG
jgi:hypothetical protein